MKDTLAKRLKQCRKEKGFTQYGVAIAILLKRLIKIMSEILLKIADVFNVYLDYLVGRTIKSKFTNSNTL